MYEFVTHTWNPIKGKCYHDCSYCYMKKINPDAQPVRLVENELQGDFGINKFIFVGSSTDMFAQNVKDEWIKEVLDFALLRPPDKHSKKGHVLCFRQRIYNACCNSSATRCLMWKESKP